MSTQVQRWTAAVVSAHENGGFVAYGDYLALQAALEQQAAEIDLLAGELNAMKEWKDSMRDKMAEKDAEIERLNAGWQKANQDALEAKLTIKAQAKDILLLCDDLKYIGGIARRAGMPVEDDNLKIRAAILGAVQILEAERDALQAKLDALEKQEPAAFVFGYAVRNPKEPAWPCEVVREESQARAIATKLYQSEIIPLVAAPKEQEPLTEGVDEITELSDAQILVLWESTYVQRGWTGIEFARAIERAHGIGGQP